MVNPMAPMPPKRSKQSKANVSFALFQIVLTINDPESQVFPTLPQGMSMPTVPLPLSHIPSASGTEHDPKNCDSRFGFHLPPRIHGQGTSGRTGPLVAGFSNANPSITTRVSPIAPVANASRSEIPIDPVLLAESQYQSSRHPPPVVYHFSSSQVRQGPTPLPSDKNPFTSGQSKGQDTGIDTHTSGTCDSDGSVDDRAGESGVEYESDGGNSSDGELEYVSPSHAKAHVHTSFPVNAHELHDPTLGAFHFVRSVLVFILSQQYPVLISPHLKMSDSPRHSFVFPVRA